MNFLSLIVLKLFRGHVRRTLLFLRIHQRTLNSHFYEICKEHNWAKSCVYYRRKIYCEQLAYVCWRHAVARVSPIKIKRTNQRQRSVIKLEPHQFCYVALNSIASAWLILNGAVVQNMLLQAILDRNRFGLFKFWVIDMKMNIYI